MNPLFSRRGDYLLALLLLTAFVLAGWKVLNRPPPASFAPEPHAGFKSSAGASAFPLASAPASGPSGPSIASYDANFVSARPGQAVHAASMVELKDGSLRAVWFSGSREGAGDVTIQSAVLAPANTQWSAETTLFDRAAVERGLMRYVKKLGNPVIARAPDGSLVLWMVNVSLGGWAGSAISWARSVDEGVTWSKPRRLVTSPFLNISTLVKSPPVALEGGQTALPVYHEFVTKFAEILRLDAQGQVVDKIRIPGSRTSLQPVLLVQNAGLAKIYMRSAGVPHVTSSQTADAGKTWSSAAATALPNPDSAVAGLLTASGDTWLALNPAATGRETLSLVRLDKGSAPQAASFLILEGDLSRKAAALARPDYAARLGRELRESGADEAQARAYGESASRQLCSSEQCAQEFSYPYLLQSRDGYIHLVYTWNRTRIKHMRFDPKQAFPVGTTGVSNASGRP